MARFNKKQWQRDADLGFAGDDIMSVIRYLEKDDWKRKNLIDAHFHVVYAYAHRENNHIDFLVKNAT
jgi:hypothetical protein